MCDLNLKFLAGVQKCVSRRRAQTRSEELNNLAFS